VKLRPYAGTAPVIALLCALTGCGAQDERPTGLDGDSSRAVDFSGYWELDYGRSDNIQLELDGLLRELRRQAERRQQGVQQGPGATMVVGSGGNNGASILGLARMADLVTQSALLEIEQDPVEIAVKREGNFALQCEFHPGQYHRVDTPFGTEICGWNDHQLVFRVLLPEGLKIQHVMTLGTGGELLNIATTVVSDQVSRPFTLNRVFVRYEPGDSGYRCEMTLTRGRVCTTEAP
jgi:hypothetical protein